MDFISISFTSKPNNLLSIYIIYKYILNINDKNTKYGTPYKINILIIGKVLYALFDFSNKNPQTYAKLIKAIPKLTIIHNNFGT
jgi:hypothetical protein